MRFIVFFLTVSLSGCASVAHRDSAKVTTQMTPPPKEVFIPGVDTPVSGPGMTAQVPENQAPVPQAGEKEPNVLPPSDPRSFGISIPLGKPKKDTIR